MRHIRASGKRGTNHIFKTYLNSILIIPFEDIGMNIFFYGRMLKAGAQILTDSDHVALGLP